MKKSILLSIVIFSIFISCSDNDTPDPVNVGSPTNAKNWKGEVTGKVTLDATKTYDLTGAIIIRDGGTLTIPEGTVIKASGGTSAYIATAQGGKIFVNGTKDKPVVMTSANASPQTGDWGGLVLCGKAPTNKGGSNGETATAEVSGLTYGGNDAEDSSGSITFLRVEYTGATFSPKKEFNGVSLFAVGSGTKLDYIQSYKGGDDGFEFFGGTVNATHIVSTDSDDDSFDFADGWKGTGEYIYISGGLKAGIEGSNNEKDGNALPKTTAVIKNVTIVNPRKKGEEGVFYIKEGSGKWTVSNVYASGYNVGFHVKKTDLVSNENIKKGDVRFTNVQLDGSFTTKSEYEGSEKFFTEGDNMGAGKGKDVPDWAKGWTKGL